MAGRIPESFIDELMARIDIVEVIDARVPLKKAGKEYTACCPFHNEKTPSFTVSPTKQFYHCFGCGAHGTAIGFLMDYEHLDFVSSIEELASRAGLEVPREAGDERPGDGVAATLYPLMEQADTYYQTQLRQHPEAVRAVEYLRGRGLSGDIAQRFGVGFAPPGWHNLRDKLSNDAQSRAKLLQTGMIIEKEGGNLYDRFRDRIMFPIRDRRGRVIAFGGRVLGDGTPKYLNSPETPIFHKGRELYGLFEACRAERQLRQLLVVEGYMDVVALAQHGIGNCVATLGTATTAEHIERLFRVVGEVVFCFDGDRAGRDAAWKALKTALPLLRGQRQVRFLLLPEGHDPDSLVRAEGADRFRERIATAATLSGFFFEQLALDLDLDSVDGRAQLVERARGHLARLPEGAFRSLMTDRLAELSHMDRDELAGLVKSGQPAPQSAPQSAVRQKKRPVSGRPGPSPLRTALALLVQYPALGAGLDPPGPWRRLEQPGIALLVHVLEILRTSPNLTTGALIERCRQVEGGNHLARLAVMQLHVPDSGVEPEIRGALARLDEQYRAQVTERLLSKSQASGLDANEKNELLQLLAGQTDSVQGSLPE